MRKILNLGLVLFVVCALGGCGRSEDPKELILGKWNVKQDFGNRKISGKTEFRKSGGMTTEVMGTKMESRYKFIDDDSIEVEMTVGRMKMTEINKIESITKTKMVLVDPQGVKAEFTRPK
ncbi:MAG: hypothetical protein ACJ8FY_09390 [Gemmataceae bacterium]